MPSEHVYIAILSNNESTEIEPQYLGRRLAAIAVGEPIAEPRILKADPAVLDQYVGVYRDQADETITIQREGDRLFAQATGDPQVEMFPVAPDAFVTKAFDAKVIFVRDKSQKISGLNLGSGDQTSQYVKLK
jgi:hypothetical protein